MAKVIALADGFYNGARVRAGTTFEAEGKASWFAPVDSAVSKPDKVDSGKKAPTTLSELGKQPAQPPVAKGQSGDDLV